MADNRLNLVVNFAQAGLNQLTGGLKNLVGLGRSGSDAMRDLGRESGRTRRELGEVRRQIEGASGNVSELIERERELERQLEQTNAAMKRQKALNEIDGRADAMRSRGSDLMGKGRDNVAGGLGMLAPLLLAGKVGADFSSTMVDIQQKAELSDTAMQGVRNTILEAARAGAQLPDQMAAAVDTMAGLGLATEDAATVAKPMARFMTAFKVEGTDAAASIYAGLKTMNIPLAETSKLLDMMAMGGNVGAFEVSDMAAAFPSLTAQMKALGQTGQSGTAELVAMLETVRKGTGDSAQAATQAGDLLGKLSAPATVAAFKKNFGIDVPAALKKGAAAGISPLETMIALTKKATGGDLSRLGYAFADKEAGGAMRTLILEYDNFVKAKKQVAEANGLTDKSFDQRVANDQSVQLRMLGGAMTDLALSVAPVLLPFLRQMTTMLTSGAAAMSDWARRNPAAAAMLMKLIAGLAIGRIALGGLQLAFGGLLGPMSTAYKYFGRVDGISRFCSHLTKLKGGLATAARVGVQAFGVLRTGAMFLARGLMRAGLMMLANRMILAIVAIVAVVGLLAYAIYANWDRIKAAFGAGLAWLSGSWQRFKGMFLEGVAFLLGLRARFLQMGKDLIVGLANGILSAPGRVWGALKSVVMGGVNGVKKLLGIASPSRLFMSYGGFLSEGMAIGIDKRRQAAFSSARRLAAGVAGAATLTAGAAFAPASAAAGPRSMGSAPAAPIAITVNAAPGQSPEAIAKAVREELDRARREDEARRRSSFEDDA